MKRIVSLALLFSMGSAFGSPMTLKIADDGKTEFVATGRPSMLRIHGQSKGPEGSVVLDGNTITATLSLNLSDLSTGIDLRDNHMKEKYLEVKSYPTAILTLKPLVLPKFEGDGSKEVPFTGDLNLHGNTKPVSGIAVISSKNNGYTIAARYPIHLSDFKIEIPSYMGIKVADDVNVTVQLKVQR
jgi:polyisoprenoid-binding protein YceI